MPDAAPQPRRFFTEDSFDFEIRLALGAVQYRCADAGEVFATADGIADGDPDAWFDGWCATAERVRGIAEAARAAGRHASARDAYLRAGKYYGMAFFFALATKDPARGPATWRSHRDCLDAAIALWPTPVERVAIPYEGTTLQGWWLSATLPGPRPLAILNNGSDGTALDMIVAGGAAAVERGWHALIFDGPGQGAALYETGLPFRPDWEAVVTPVVNFALTRPSVDPARIALLGLSQGGYWAPRAAAFEHRLAACVADPGVVKVATSWFDNFPPDAVAYFHSADKASFDAGMREGLAQFPALQRGMLAKRCEPFCTDSLHDILTGLAAYDLTGVAAQIRCPTLVTDPDDEAFWPGAPRPAHLPEDADPLHPRRGRRRPLRADGPGAAQSAGLRLARADARRHSFVTLGASMPPAIGDGRPPPARPVRR
jgi:hypothetical protein